MHRMFFVKIAAMFVGVTAIVLVSTSPVAASSLSVTTLVTGGLQNKGSNRDVSAHGFNAVTADGSVFVYKSAASNLVPGDTNGKVDIFTYNRLTRKTERIGMDNNLVQANDNSDGATISANGRYIAFATRATNMTNEISDNKCSDPPCTDVFVRDLWTHHNTLVSLSTEGAQLHATPGAVPAISANGKFVAFASPGMISPNDTNGGSDILVRDLQAHTTTLASVDNNGHTDVPFSENPSISADGRYVAFDTLGVLTPDKSPGRWDVFVRDMRTSHTTLASIGGNYGNDDTYGSSQNPVISADGRSVAFESTSNALVPHTTGYVRGIFVRNLVAGKTRLASIGRHGEQANGTSFDPSISADGRYVVFSSDATNLVAVDSNGASDVFMNYRDYGLTRRVNVASYGGSPADGGSSGRAVISADGKAVVFSSTATNLTPIRVPYFLENLYVNYNPVVNIPYYDPIDSLGFMPGF